MFATAVLWNAEGNLLTEHLNGTLSTPDMLLEEQMAREVAFVFPDLAVLCSGTYSIRVDVCIVDYVSRGVVLLGQTETRIFKVYDVDVPPERLCEFPPDTGSCLVLFQFCPSSGLCTRILWELVQKAICNAGKCDEDGLDACPFVPLSYRGRPERLCVPHLRVMGQTAASRIHARPAQRCGMRGLWDNNIESKRYARPQKANTATRKAKPIV